MNLEIQGIFKTIKDPTTKDINVALLSLDQNLSTYIQLIVELGEYFRLNKNSNGKYSVEYCSGFGNDILTISKEFEKSEAEKVFITFYSDLSIKHIPYAWVSYKALLIPKLRPSLITLIVILILSIVNLIYNSPEVYSFILDVLLSIIWFWYMFNNYKLLWFYIGKSTIKRQPGIDVHLSMATLGVWFFLLIRMLKYIIETLFNRAP